MNNFNKNKVLNDVINSFAESRNLFEELTASYKNGSRNLFKKTRLIYQACSKTSPIFRLEEHILNYHLTTEFRDEINYNILNQNTGYFDLAQNMLLQHYRFMNFEFENVIEDYLKNEMKWRNTVDLIGYDPKTLSDNKFYKYVPYQYVQIFRWFEEQFGELYSSYTPLLTGYTNSQVPYVYNDYIFLKYGEDCATAIELIYEALYPIYIETSFENFKQHFFPPAKYEPILWKKELVSLITLFFGQRIKLGRKLLSLKIETHNRSVANMLFEHFSDDKGEKFKHSTIVSMGNPERIKIEYNLQHPLTSLLIKLHELGDSFKIR
jgi:hypothetical protein